MKEHTGNVYEKNRGRDICEEISMRCQRQRDNLARQKERLKRQRLRLAGRRLDRLSPPEAVSQAVVDEVAYSLLETLYDD
jgi:hypothetical protein